MPLKLLASTLLLLVLLALGYSISTLPPLLTPTPIEPTIETWTKTNEPTVTSLPTTMETAVSLSPTDFPFISVTPPKSSATATPSGLTPTPDAVQPSLTPVPTPTKTLQPPTNLQACLNTPAATCPLDHNLTLDTTLTISATGVTLSCVNGATIKTSTSNLGRALTINNAIAVHVQGCSFSRELNTIKACCGDLILIAHSEDITLDHVTACCSIDEILDIVHSTDVDVLYSALVYPQHCSTHKNGCHGFNVLVNNSEVLFDHDLFASGKARLPLCQASTCVVENSIYYNIDAQGLSSVGPSTIIFRGNILLSGPDTDTEFYAIVSPNPTDYLEHPTICENGNRLMGAVVYRVRRPSDRSFYVECPVVPLPSEAEYWKRLNMVGAPLSQLTALIRKSIVEGRGRIVNVPIG